MAQELEGFDATAKRASPLGGAGIYSGLSTSPWRPMFFCKRDSQGCGSVPKVKRITKKTTYICIYIMNLSLY